ncbi:g1926 [Coccomyxa elongata]
MSTGRLKASTNRVRTSTTLQGNSMWTNTIGSVDPQAGSNSVIEASLNAPQYGGGRAARRAAAQEAVAQTGGFDTAVNNYESLLSLARSQGAVGGQNRGACKKCGQIGHLTKQCYNNISLTDTPSQVQDGRAPVAPVLPPVAEGDEQSSDITLSSSDSDSDSDGSSSSEDDRKKRKKDKASKKRKERKEKHKKDKKKRKHKKEKRKKKKQRRSSPSSSE